MITDSELGKNMATISAEIPEKIKNPGNHNIKISSQTRFNMNEILLEKTGLSIYEAFISKFPHGIDYSLSRENLEGKDYLELSIGGKKYYATGAKGFSGILGEHICISIYQDLDFFNSRSKKIDISADGNVSAWDSKYGANLGKIENIDLDGILMALLKKLKDC